MTTGYATFCDLIVAVVLGAVRDLLGPLGVLMLRREHQLSLGQVLHQAISYKVGAHDLAEVETYVAYRTRIQIHLELVDVYPESYQDQIEGKLSDKGQGEENSPPPCLFLFLKDCVCHLFLLLDLIFLGDLRLQIRISIVFFRV